MTREIFPFPFRQLVITYLHSDNNLISLLLHGDDKFDGTKNRKTLMLTFRFIKDSQRFDEQLFR